MGDNNLKSRTISSVLWSALGRFGTMGITFVANIILARLLTPEDFGCIGMLQIFIAISEVLVLGGFGAALIQKRNPTHVDYTTVFYWNLIVSVVMFFILYVTAPYIADFYSMPLLCDVLRAQGLSVIIYAFSVVQSTQLQKELRFKELSIRGIVAAFAGVVVATIMAYRGWGVWSLVVMHLVIPFSSALLLWRMSSWRPSLEFSWNSFKELFSFGGLVALSSLVETVYSNIQGLVIGKWFTPKDLGYYTQARKLEQVPTSALSMIVGQVAFPVFSLLNDDTEKLKAAVRKNIVSITYINFPLCILLIVIAKPLIILLYGNQWIESVDYFQILCLSGMVYTLNTTNVNVIKSMGKGKIYFYTQLLKRLIGLCLIFAGIPFGVDGVVWAVAIYSYVGLIINATTNYILLKYGFVQQIKDTFVNLIVAVVVGIVVICMGYITGINELMMIVQIFIYIVLFLFISHILNLEGYSTFISLLHSLNGINKFR